MTSNFQDTWDTTPCRLVNRYVSGTCCLHIQGLSSPRELTYSSNEDGARNSSESLVAIYKSIRCNASDVFDHHWERQMS